MRTTLWLGLCLLILFALNVVDASETGRKKKKGKAKHSDKASLPSSIAKEGKLTATKSDSKKSKAKAKGRDKKRKQSHKRRKRSSSKKHRESNSSSSTSDGSSSSSSSSSSSRSSVKEESDSLSLWNKPVQEVNAIMGFPSIITKCHKKGDLALTFDDGLSAVTPDVIEMLKRENVKGTFFVIGQTLEHGSFDGRTPKEILELLIENGHEVGSHTYSHPNINEYWPPGIECEMNKTAGLLEVLIGRRPRFMRPPFGNANEQAVRTLHNLGYFIINWNADTNDWLHKYEPEQAVLEFSTKVPSLEYIKSLGWQKGSEYQVSLLDALDSKIVLMHDIHPSIVLYGPRIIAHARALGYNFVTMSECLGGVSPYFKN